MPLKMHIEKKISNFTTSELGDNWTHSLSSNRISRISLVFIKITQIYRFQEHFELWKKKSYLNSNDLEQEINVMLLRMHFIL